jgi:fimbrial isopeptide formation D2 family protein/LPXTG-motif cell wall-anchored protein
MKFLTIMFAVILLTATMLHAMAFAAPTEGRLIIHKYVMPDKSVANIDGNGTQVAPGDLPDTAKPLEGVTFKIFRVTIQADGIYPAPGELTLNNMVNPTSFTDSLGKGFSVVPADGTPAVITHADGEATTALLPQGIYLVVEMAHAGVTSPAAPFVVAVPMVNPTGDGWLDMVHVYPKNEMLTFEKTVSIDSVQVGDPVVYTLVPAVPSDIADATSYKIVDQLDPALDFVSVSSVKAAATKAGLASGTSLTAGTHYTVVPTAATADGPRVEIVLTEAGREYLGDNDFRYLEIILNTTVNEAILTSATVGNTAEINFTNQYGEDKVITSTNEDGDPETKIHTAAISITAQDGISFAKLAGAEFRIASSAANAADGNFLKKDATGKILDVGDPGYATATQWVAVTVSPDGLASFVGLRDYTKAGDVKNYLSYYLVETKAPTGYNMVPDPIVVTFSAANSTEANDYTIAITVNHYKGFTLPKTGGMGTLIFTVGGIALVGLAVIILISTKKKKDITA